MPRPLPDLGALALLVAVDELGSLGAAARQVGVAQPNASRTVKGLERDLGVPLLRRGARGSTLTPQGTVVVHWARRVVADADRLLDAADSLREARQVELTVVASMTVAEHLVPAWLGELRARHDGIRIHLHVQNSTQTFERVADGTCDVGFVESPSVPRGLFSTTVAHDRLVVVVTADHPWARRRRPLTASELAATSLVEREPGSGTRTTLDDALSGHDRAQPLLELSSGAAIRASVLAGVGPAVISTLAVADQLAVGSLRAVPVDGLSLGRRLRAVWRALRRLEGPAGELVTIARSWPT
ncbi:LysR family transcriptional regulator [Humibacillus sp. DSM 29435]|uniref:LysR substrate-binding domain-containing protein n=1 Tax=Humibacillus sp. DSM 29435 TaxID=1869167 RepID=UPI0008733236|nr:LysR substrate-binding domain-containing protein [Humibacillus sp. DSM 29435]OFE18405.1 LysR family transcriptional regulator [Humibacillus sp. DSM 29435]